MIKKYLISIVLLFYLVSSFGKPDLYVNTDRNFYFNGDIIGFNLWFSVGKETPIIYIDLVDQSGIIVDNQIIKSTENLSFGCITLPLDLETQWCVIRAYTLGAQSGDIVHYGSKIFPVYNTFEMGEHITTWHPNSPEYSIGDTTKFTISIISGSNIFNRRSPVVFHVKVEEEDNINLIYNLSVKVIDSVFWEAGNNILRSFNLVPEFENPVQSSDEPVRSELNYSAKLKTDKSNFLLSLYLADDRQLTWAALDKESHFNIPLGEFYGSKSGQLLGMNPLGETYYFPQEQTESIRNYPSIDFPPKPPPYSPEILYALDLTRKRHIIADIFENRDDEDKEEKVTAMPGVRFKPDKKYVIDDYVRFADTEDFIQEVIPSVKIRKTDQGDSYFSILLGNKIFSLHEPLMFLNHYMVTSAKELLELDINDLERIEVFREDKTILDHFGIIGQNGVVSFYTRDGKLRPENGSQLQIQGLTKQNAIILPAGDWSDKSRPIFSPVLYWNASVLTDRNGMATISFTTTDDTGPYIIEVQVDTENGSAGRKSQLIYLSEVK